MSTTYQPIAKAGVAQTPWSYEDGGFDANVDAGEKLGRIHQVLGLPLDPHALRYDTMRTPFHATAAEASSWAARIEEVLLALHGEAPLAEGWCAFLKTCGGYTVLM